MRTDSAVLKLYSDNYRGPDIAKKLNIHVRQVYRILEKHHLTRRSSAQQNRIRFLNSPLSFKFKEKLSAKERELFIAGLMLYYGEGAKACTL